MRVLFVSKPVVAPFHDGSICLVRDIAAGLERWQPSVMAVRGETATLPGAEAVSVYARGGAYAPALLQNMRALSYLTRERRADLWHFVFAPNPRSSLAISALRRLRRLPCVQTVASPPRDFRTARRLLFGDIVVAQSEWTRRRLAEVAPEVDLRLIRPPLAPVPRPSRESQEQLRAALAIGPAQTVVVYPGDLEFSQGAERVAACIPQLSIAHPGLVVVFACRRKTARALSVEARLASSLPSSNVRFAGELPSLLPLLALAKVVLFPVEQLYAKVDIPISILEAMALETPVIVPTRGPLGELSAAVRVEPRPEELVREVGALLSDGEHRRAVIAAQTRLLAEQFDARRAAADYEQLYDRLVAAAP